MADETKSPLAAFLDSLIDKVLIAVLATAVSSFVFYGFTAYSKALETMQAQSRATSDLAFAFRDVVLKNTAKLIGDIKVDYLTGNPKLSDKVHKSALVVAGDIGRDAKVLSSFLSESSEAGAAIAQALKEDAFEFHSIGWSQEKLDAFDSELATLQTTFITKFNSEIGVASAKEFRTFFDAFQAQIPAEFQPVYIALASLFFVAVFIAAIQIWRALSVRTNTVVAVRRARPFVRRNKAINSRRFPRPSQ